MSTPASPLQPSRNVNSELARLFDQMAASLELLGENRFKVNAHARVARVLRDLTDEVDRLVARESDVDPVKVLTSIEGIGKTSAMKILEYLDKGYIAEHQKLLEKIPAGLFDLLAIPGLGPKTVRLMWERMTICDLADLKSKLDSDELTALPRMGAKTIENMRRAIEFAEKSQGRIQIGLVRPIALAIVERLRAVEGVIQVEFAGSLRRGRETIGDIDILVSCEDSAKVSAVFCEMPEVIQVLAQGETKSSVRLEHRHKVIQADLRIVPESSYGAALMYFTGSKEHNVRMRELAVKRGMRLNEYGLYEGTDDRPQDVTGDESGSDHRSASLRSHRLKTCATDLHRLQTCATDLHRLQTCATEREVFEALGLEWMPPEIREDRGEFSPPGGSIPRLIERADIKAELHTHTIASDGKMTLEESVACAVSLGYHTIAVTDHSVSSSQAGGLDPDRLRRHIEAIRELNERVADITLLAGSEVDILTDGRLDYEDDLLAELDVVVASPHVSLRQDTEKATRRLLAAIEHPLVHIVGHPTGRIVNGREGLSPDMPTLFAAASEHDTALEINANWKRLDLRDTHVRSAVHEYGCLISVNTDTHWPEHFDFMDYGILTARRGWLTADRCVNAWSAERLHEWLGSKR